MMNSLNKAIFLSLLICLGERGYGQTDKSRLSDSCSYVISGLSHFWGIDSLGLNGYRLQVYKRVVNCKGNDITEDFVLRKLGSPMEVKNTNKGKMLTYIVFDGTKMPKPSFEIGTIYFIFDAQKRLVDKGESVRDKW